MKIQIVGPVCNTGYGLTTANLTQKLMEVGEDVRLLPMGNIALTWALGHVEEACRAAWEVQREAKDLPDVTLCIWHEWDHPPKDLSQFHKLMNMSRYVAMPTFELDRVRPQAVAALSKCFRVVVSSEHNFNVLLSHGLTNIRKVTHHGVDTEMFKSNGYEAAFKSTNRPFMMLNIGKMEKRKGHDLCVRVLAYMMHKEANVRLWTLWDNPFMSHPQQQELLGGWVDKAAEEFHVNRDVLMEHIVQLRERRHTEDMVSVICACPISIYPFRAEGWNLPLLEAMACERPVVATNATGPREYLTEYNVSLIEQTTKAKAEDGIWFGDGLAEGNWYEPNFDQLAYHVDTLHLMWKTGTLTPNHEGRLTARAYSWTNASKRLRTWLQSGCE